MGCNFFDTAWAYGDGHSERLLAQLLRRHPDERLYIATKVPPKNRQWPGRASDALADVFPPDYIREYAEKSLANIGVPAIDLLQFHVRKRRLGGRFRVAASRRRAAIRRAREGHRHQRQPMAAAQCPASLDAGLIDAVQVVYNIFDQTPEDELFPACREKNIAVIARVPFDEGSLG